MPNRLRRDWLDGRHCLVELSNGARWKMKKQFGSIAFAILIVLAWVPASRGEDPLQLVRLRNRFWFSPQPAPQMP